MRRNYESQIAYIHGRIEHEIEGFANSLGIPTLVLTERLAELLHARRSGVEDSMPGLREISSKRSEKLGKTLEVAERTHLGSQAIKSPKPAKKRTNSYWANMTPEQRSAEIKRRFAKRGKKKNEDHRHQ